MKKEEFAILKHFERANSVAKHVYEYISDKNNIEPQYKIVWNDIDLCFDIWQRYYKINCEVVIHHSELIDSLYLDSVSDLEDLAFFVEYRKLERELMNETEEK